MAAVSQRTVIAPEAMKDVRPIAAELQLKAQVPAKGATPQPTVTKDRQLAYDKRRDATADEASADSVDGEATDTSLAAHVSLATSLLPSAQTADLQADAMLHADSISPTNPKFPAAPDPNSGLIIGTGGLVGSLSQLLGSTTTGLFGGDGYVHNGNLAVSSTNFTQVYGVTSVLGIPVVNLTPVGTAVADLGGAATGSSSHLTLIGGVDSGSYIDNINNGSPGGVLGLLLPSQAPAWASTCANLLGLVQTQCWAVNAAQDYQVLVGDGASANGSKEVVIGTNASHTLPAQDANDAFPGAGVTDPNDPTGVPTSDYESRLGHSVVVGDDAAGTANAQTILGAEATSNQPNSVALGYQSDASRGPQASYMAPGLSAPQSSAGEVSIGSPGHERQLTNVAAGSAATDAVNLSQLMSVADATDNAVQYDDVGKATITLAGSPSVDGGITGGTRIGNVAQGAVDADSTDAVNGAQLFATNQNVTNLGDQVNTIYTVGTKYFQANSTGAGSVALGADSIAAGLGSQAISANSIAIGNTAIAGDATDATLTSEVAVGNNAKASAQDSVALGDGALASGSQSIAAGSGAQATSAQSSAFGVNADAGGVGSTAVGQGAVTAADGSTALGQMANATAAGGVALGLGSVASTALGQVGYVPGAAATADVTAIHATTSTSGAVSVGNAAAGQFRQITGVAAGTTASDAVNVAQLTAVDNQVAALGDSAVQYDANPDTTPNYGSVTLAGPVSTDGGVTGGTTISNLHQGDVSATSTDAVNGSQLFATNAAVTVVGTHVTNLGTSVALGLGGNSSYDASTGTLTTNLNYAGASYASVQNVFDQIGSAIDGDGIKYFHANSVLADSAATGTDSVAVGPLAVASGDGAVALGANTSVSSTGTDTNVALGANSKADGSTLAVAAYNPGTGALAGLTPVGEVSVGSPGNERRITNVAAGAGGTDAVNVSQLESVVATSAANAVQYDDASHASVTLSGPVSTDGGVTGGTTISNLHQGDVSATSTDAINGAQFYAVAGDTSNTYITNNGTGVRYVRTNDTGLAAADAHAQGQGSTAVGYDATSSAVDSVAIGRDSSAVNIGDVALGANSVTDAVHTGTFDESAAGGTAAAATMADSVVSIGSAGHERQIQNVAAGVLSATSTDAVNGSQLFSTNSILGDITDGGGIKYFHANSALADSQALGTDSVAIGPVAVANNTDSIAIGNGANASNDDSVALGAGSSTSAAVADGGATIADIQYVFAGAAPTGVVSVGSAGNERQITNVAAGQLSATSTDAVNGSQLYATNQALDSLNNTVKNINPGGGSNKYFHANSTGADSSATGADAVAIGSSAVASGTNAIASGSGSSASGANDAAYGSGSTASGGNSTAVGGDSVASGSTSTALGSGAKATNDNSVAIGAGSVTDRDNSVSVGSDGEARQITHVAAGTQTTDAVNMGQLTASENGAVHYDSNTDGSIDYNSVTLGSDTGTTTVHNVGAGSAPTDAVNVNQLNEGVTTAENWSKSYTDQRFSQINSSIQNVNNRANAGVASAMAMAGLPQAYEPGKSMAAVSAGSFHGESSLAIGVSTISEGGRWVYKLTGSSDTRGDAGVSIGAGMQW